MRMKNDATILLIDDDADDREIFELALSEAAPTYTCITARSGLEALDRLIGGDIKPDCIFLDLNMPRMNGAQCLEGIKKESQLSDIPVVIYTTSSEGRDRETTLALGATAFITKPPEIGELITALANIFANL